MDDGRYINDSTLNSKTGATNAVWAVRGAGAGGAVQLAATGYYDEPSQIVKGDDGDLRTGVGLTFARFLTTARNCNRHGYRFDLDEGSGLHQRGLGRCGNPGAVAGERCLRPDRRIEARNWRLPNRNEMQSLEDRMVSNQADFMNATYVWKSDAALYRSPIFTNFVGSVYYWTSTTNAAAATEAWAAFSCDFGVYDVSKSNTGFALAVRDRQ